MIFELIRGLGAWFNFPIFSPFGVSEMQQVNDLVKVIAPSHNHEGKAGIVVTTEGEIVTVKLDTVTEPQDFTTDELQFLGR